MPAYSHTKHYLKMKHIPNNIFFTWVEQEIKTGRSVRFRIKGQSMFPLLRDGKDEVILQPFLKEELAPMDVVLFKFKDKHMLHRIIRKEDERLYIQGDGSFVAKEECTTNDVIGKVGIIVKPSGKMIPTDSWKWKIPSFLWTKTGVFKSYLLRLLHRIM